MGTTTTPTEQAILDAISDGVRENRTRVVYTITQALEAEGIRSLLAVVGTGDYPQVSVTLSIDDVTQEIVKQVVAALLGRAGLPSDMVAMFSGVAGPAVARWLAAQRQRAAQRRVAPPGAADPQSTGTPPENAQQQQGAGGGMKWNPNAGWGKKS